MTKKFDTQNWSREAYILIGREDLAHQLDVDNRSMSSTVDIHSNLHPNLLLYEETDANSKRKSLFIENEVTYLRFHKDLRLKEVKKLLSSSQIVAIKTGTSGTLFMYSG